MTIHHPATHALALLLVMSALVGACGAPSASPHASPPIGSARPIAEVQPVVVDAPVESIVAGEADGATTTEPAEAVVPAPPVAAAPAPIRIPKPAVPTGPRRVGLQVGHWRIDEVPDELRRIENQTGTSGGGVPEWQLNLDIANRVAATLRAHGYAVDILPATVPAGYLADAFVSLHADGDAAGTGRGFKAAHGSRRGPYEGQLVRALVEEYGRATGLPQDDRITRNMLGYYAFSWTRFTSSVAPHTPSAIFEMGFLTSPADRAVLLGRRDEVANGIANGILRFLADVPAGAAFADDLVVAPLPPRPPAGGPPGSSPAAAPAAPAARNRA